MYDIDYEIYKYIDEQADRYVEFNELLKQNNITIEDAKQKIKQFKENFYSLLEKYAIGSQNIVVTCYDLMERIRQQPDNLDLQYLYLCVMTDFGVLNTYDCDEEQVIRNYLRQNELIRELTEFFKLHSVNRRKLHELKKYLKKPVKKKNEECEEETDFLYHLTIQHTFLHDSIKNEVYKENLKYLLEHINCHEKLKSVKPYIIFGVLARKTGMMQKRRHFMPTLKAIFQYQDYNIYRDNGKNFNQYQSVLELYDHLKRAYIDEADINFCDFCFANLSPLSEWYYLNCEPNEDIPVTAYRKILTVMPESFPVIMSYDDYGRLNEDELQMYGKAEEKLREKMLQTVMYL